MEGGDEASCVASLRQMALAGDATGFVTGVEAALLAYKNMFKNVLTILSTVLFTAQTDPATSMRFVTACLCHIEASEQPPEKWSQGLRYLLLETIPADLPASAVGTCKQSAAQLLRCYASPQTAKLAVKVACAYRLTSADVADQLDALAALVGQLVAERATAGAGVRLMLQFEGLDEVAGVDKAATLAALLEGGQEALCEQWVATQGHEHQVAYVRACVEMGRMRAAVHAVRALRLAAEFPDIKLQYRQRTLTRLVRKRLWQVAQSFAGKDRQLQALVLREMVGAGEAGLAAVYADQWGIPQSALRVAPEQLAAEEAERRTRYLQLSLPPSAVVVVDTPEGLAEAGAALSSAAAVGLDCEWRPCHQAGTSSRASLLQVATEERVFLFDLVRLGDSHPLELSDCLGPVLAPPVPLKLGFELAGDLTKLASSYPAVAAFHAPIQGALDLRPLWVAWGLQAHHLGGQVSALRGVGLWTLASVLLGKPLDKSMQMSDWELRPLSQRQAEYAALDAHVLLLLLQELRQRLGPEAAERLIAQHQWTYQARPTRPHSSGRSGASSVASDGGGGGAASCSRGHGGAVDAVAPSAASGELERPALPTAVQRVLQQQGLGDAVRWLPQALRDQCSADAMSASGALAVQPARVVKSVALLAERRPLLLLMRGDQRIDMLKLARHLALPARAVRLATHAQCQQLWGFVPGTVPPVGHPPEVTTLMDRALFLEQQEGSCPGSGSASASSSSEASSAGCGHARECADEAAAAAAAHSDAPGTRARCAAYYCGAGVPGAVLLLTASQLLQLSGAGVADLAASPAGAPSGGDPADREDASKGAASEAAQRDGGPPSTSAAAGPPRFLVDGALGRLCRWLRCLGVDAEQVPHGVRSAQMPALAASAAREGRVLLTADRRLGARRDAGAAFLVAATEPREQLALVAQHFGIRYCEGDLMTRCAACNAADFRPLAKAEVEGLVAEHVFAAVDEFFACGQCKKLFWVGPKSRSAQRFIEGLVELGTVPAAEGL